MPFGYCALRGLTLKLRNYQKVKIMNPNIPRVAGLVFLGLIAFTVYERNRNQRLTTLNEESVAAITYSLGRLTVALALLGTNSPLMTQKVVDELNSAIVPLSLVVISGNVDVASLKAESFAGLCLLIANADRLFPLNPGDPIVQQVNRLLNSQFHRLEATVKIESTARSLRPGDRHKCELK
jgi:hypothetical protein